MCHSLEWLRYQRERRLLDFLASHLFADTELVKEAFQQRQATDTRRRQQGHTLHSLSWLNLIFILVLELV